MFPRDVKRTALKLFTQLDTPRSLTCAILLRYEEMDQLVSLTVDPRSYDPVDWRVGRRRLSDPICMEGIARFRKDIQATEFLRKCDGLATSYDLEERAVEGFYASEKQCKQTNDLLQFLLELPVSKTKLEKRMRLVVEKARTWLKATLGSLPEVLDGRFGPGATFESNTWGWSRRNATAYDKLSCTPCITPAAAYLEDVCLWQHPIGKAWANAVPDRWIPRVRGNRFTTAPKDATKRRGICIEPGANLIMQLAVGGVLRSRLKRAGIDLISGQDLHRLLAQLASELGHLATIDLSNASDTVAYLLVKLLFPADWFALLDSLRSPMTYLETNGHGRWVKLEKFSSMGNGFTFELETLLFCALLHAAGCNIGTDTYVYGDDIICPTERSADALAILRAFGFTPNPRKTFTQGWFRESCGGDFFAGQAVRPYYMKELPDDATSWIGVANGLWRSSKRLELPAMLAARNNALDNVPSDIRRCRGPEALGDLVVTDDDEATWQSSVRSSIRYLRVWRPVISKDPLYYRRRVRDARFGPPAPGRYTWVTTRRSKRYVKGTDHAAALLGLPSDGLAPRECVGGYRFGRIAWS